MMERIVMASASNKIFIVSPMRKSGFSGSWISRRLALTTLHPVPVAPWGWDALPAFT